MTHKDLRTHLGLPETSTAKEIDTAYTVRKSELEENINSAPTTALKKKCYIALKELEYLYRGLGEQQGAAAPDDLSATMMQDLPKAQPFYSDDGGIGPESVTAEAQLGIESGDILMNRYEVRRMLGAGGMGAVYAAFDRDTKREIAVKVLLPSLLKKERLLKEFMTVAKLSQQLSHPGITNVFDVHKDEAKGFYFLTMELLEGQTLRHAMDVHRDTGKLFSPEEALEIAEQLCNALSYAHKYTVHGDLKPENVFLTESGDIKLMDFGIAHLLETSQPTKTVTSMDTAYYKAPEQLNGAQDVDPRSDQYSLAIILYELLAGEVSVGKIKNLNEKRKDIPKGLSEAVAKGLSASISNRFADMETFAAALHKKEVQVKLPFTKILAVAAVIGVLVLCALTYPKWSPSLLPLFQDSELADNVEKAHTTAMARQQSWEVIKPVLDTAPPPEIAKAEELLEGGHNLTAEKKLAEALVSYTEAGKQFESAITIQMNLLYTTALESQSRVLALKERLEKQQKILDKRAQETRNEIDKYERQEKKDQLAQAKTKLILLESLIALCDRDIFSGPELLQIKGKLIVADGMIRDKEYPGALAALQETETGLQNLLTQVASVEKTLAEKHKTLAAAEKWQAISAQDIDNPEEINQAESDLSKANSFFENCSWLKATETYISAQNYYRSAIGKGEAILKERAAAKLAAEKSLTKKVLSDFVKVPGGCFQMGDTFDDGYGDEKPVHEVCVDDFSLGRYEITQGLWKRIMGNNPSYFKKGYNYPVEGVSWNDVQEFIMRLNTITGRNFRLPTEAEWEYAARSGGRKEKYSGGTRAGSVAWHDDNSGSSTHSVGFKFPNDLGLYDMSGNVWEWCSDWYDENYYSSSPRNNPQGPSSGSYRVNRGGSWNYKQRFARTTYRRGREPERREGTFGFRLVLVQFSDVISH